MDLKYDVLVKVRFKTEAEGGRKSSLKAGYYSSPFFVGGKGFDCRMMIIGQGLQLGEWYDCPVKFLCPEMVLPHIAVGQPFTLWEGKEVANGTLLSIYEKDEA